MSSQPIEITARKVTVYQVNGKGKCHRQKRVAYRWAAIELVNEACRCPAIVRADEPFEGCRFCRRTCEGHDSLSHFSPNDIHNSCEQDETHSYRYRLIGRLARWLMWRDTRKATP